MLKENEQTFLHACMQGDEVVNRNLFHIRAWFF